MNNVIDAALAAIEQERDRVQRAIDILSTGAPTRHKPHGNTGKHHTWSKAQRAKKAKQMKAHWAKRRKAKR